MMTPPVPVWRAPSTYLDTSEPTIDHSQPPVAPMVKDRTTLLVGLTFGEPDDGATFDGDVIVTAATDFDGTVTLSLLPILGDWTPSIGVADEPTRWAVSPVTWTGVLLAGRTATFDVGAFGSTVATGAEDALGFAIIRTDTGTAGSLFTGRIRDSRAPTLLGSWLSAPDTPTGLVPNNNKVVGVAKPVLRADAPSAPMVSQRWQVGTTSAGFADDPITGGLVTPSWDSLEDPSTVLEFDTSTATVPFAGFPAATATRYLTCQYKDSSGSWSPWATPVQCGGFQARPAPVFTAPTFGVCFDPNPAFAWTPDGTQLKYQVLTRLTDTTTVVDDSKEQPGTATAYQPTPKPLAGLGPDGGVLLKGGESVTTFLRQWDDVDRIATPGCPIYGETSTTFVFTGNATVAQPDDVTLSQIGSSPWVTFRFTTSVTFDFAIFSWGADPGTALHVARKKPENLTKTVTGEVTVWEWIFWNAQPWQPGYAGGVKLVVGGQTSNAEYGSLASLEVEGEWIGDADPNSLTYGIVATGTGTQTQLTRTDQAAIMDGLAAQFPAAQYASVGYLTGTLGGVLTDFDGVSASDWQQAWRRLTSYGRVVQYAKTDMSFPALVKDYAPNEVESIDVARKTYAASITQLDLASYADIPPGFGAPTITTFNFEALVSGAIPTEGGVILREDTALGAGSPGVVGKDGAPLFKAAAAIDGTFGADCGWRA